jgi:antitoxin HicB
MANMANRTDEHLVLPYTIESFRDDSCDGKGYVARVVELPGCMTQADSFEELGAMIEDAMRAWIETAIENGKPVPEPRRPDEYSGKFVTRLPKSLHRDVSMAAVREGVSLNAYVASTLARSVGREAEA